MGEIDKITAQVEYIILKEMINGLNDETETGMDEYQAKEVATEFLALEPFTSLQDIIAKMQTFTQKYPRFKEAYTYTSTYEEEQKTASVIEKMRSLIKDNDIDAALQVAQPS